MIRHIIITAISMYVTCSITHGHNASVERPDVFVCKSGMESPTNATKMSFLLNRSLHWRGGVVPYTIDRRFSQRQVWIIRRAMEIISRVSCVRWVPWTNSYDCVNFFWTERRSVCESAVGRRGGAQSVNLGDNCFRYDWPGNAGIVEHEMMHALGFIHEHQRLDRNCYVRVSGNAINGSPVDFAIIYGTDTSFPYDFNSIMHYGSPSITPHSGRPIGNVEGVLTDLDVLKLNYLYCGGPTFCQRFPEDCQRFEEWQRWCKPR